MSWLIPAVADLEARGALQRAGLELKFGGIFVRSSIVPSSAKEHPGTIKTFCARYEPDTELALVTEALQGLAGVVEVRIIEQDSREALYDRAGRRRPTPLRPQVVIWRERTP